MTAPTPAGGDRNTTTAVPLDPSELRRQVDYAEPRIRSAMVSAFARLLATDPVAARARLTAVNAATNLNAHLVHKGLSPESHFFGAAESALRHVPPERINLDAVKSTMLAHGADDAAVARVEDMVGAGSDRLTDRSFEAYAGAYFHLRATRMLLDHGARLELADARGQRSARLADRLATSLQRAMFARDRMRDGTRGPRDAAQDSSLRAGGRPLAKAGLAGMVFADLLREAGRKLAPNLFRLAEQRHSAERAAAALGEALDAAHATSPVPPTARPVRRPPGPSVRQAGRST